MKPNEISYNIYNPLYVEKNMDQYVRSKMSSESFITPLRVIPQNKDDKIRNQINYLEQRIYSPPPKESYQSPPQQVYQNQRQPQNYFLDPPFTNQLPLKYYPPTYSNVVDIVKIDLSNFSLNMNLIIILNLLIMLLVIILLLINKIIILIIIIIVILIRIIITMMVGIIIFIEKVIMLILMLMKEILIMIIISERGFINKK